MRAARRLTASCGPCIDLTFGTDAVFESNGVLSKRTEENKGRGEEKMKGRRKRLWQLESKKESWTDGVALL